MGQELDREVIFGHQAGAVHELKPLIVDRQADRELLDDATAESFAARRDPTPDMLVLRVELYDHFSAAGEPHHDRIGIRLDVELMRANLVVESLGELMALLAETGPDGLDLLFEDLGDPLPQRFDSCCGGASALR